MGETVIETERLGKEYGDVVAVADLTLSVEAGEIFALVGPNGAGKTTAVEMLECLRTPTSGTARVLGMDVTERPTAIKEQIGVVPQSFNTFERLSVRENVAMAAGMYSPPRDVDAVLDDLDLTEWADTRFGALSGGYQRRTGIAMAVVADPELLFLDEPTTGLDPAARRTTWGRVEALADRGTTVLLTTHYMDEVEQLADRAALLVDGRLVAVDSVDALVDDYGGDVRIVVGPAGEDAQTDDDEIRALLADVATAVHRDDAGALVGQFEDTAAAIETFGALEGRVGERPVELTTAGMDDVFLNLAGGTLDERGELS